MANLCSWSENNEQIVLIFRSEPFISELTKQKSHAQSQQSLSVIDSFQRYILLDKDIILNKGRQET
jgi:hypothetical protein